MRDRDNNGEKLETGKNVEWENQSLKKISGNMTKSIFTKMW